MAESRTSSKSRSAKNFEVCCVITPTHGLRWVGLAAISMRCEQHRAKALHSMPRLWSVVERADQPGMSPAILSTLIMAANELIDLHELRVASIENFLPAFLILLLPGVAAVAVAALAWSFGTTTERGRTPILLLTLLICAVILLIMDVNRPQRGAIGVGVATLERVQESIAPSNP